MSESLSEQHVPEPDFYRDFPMNARGIDKKNQKY